MTNKWYEFFTHTVWMYNSPRYQYRCLNCDVLFASKMYNRPMSENNCPVCLFDGTDSPPNTGRRVNE